MAGVHCYYRQYNTGKDRQEEAGAGRKAVLRKVAGAYRQGRVKELWFLQTAEWFLFPGVPGKK